jgi:hypothetical protein
MQLERNEVKRQKDWLMLCKTMFVVFEGDSNFCVKILHFRTFLSILVF